MRRGVWAGWIFAAVAPFLACSCLDFDQVEREFCDSGTSAACLKVERCTNRIDDDGDQLADCADPDCLGQSCSATTSSCATSTVCLANGTCGESPITCNSPPSFCFRAPGACDAASGTCAYSADTSIACDDSNACTNTDHCQLDGGCGGTALTCNTPPGFCFNPTGTCDPVLGCTYPVRSASCDDSSSCTFNDRCATDGGCSGTAYTCPSTECATRSCLGDGGCLSAPRTGQPCDAGICQANGSCAAFSYAPSNFNPVAIAARGISGNVMVSCNAWFDSTDGGGSWCAGQPIPAQTVVTQAGTQDVMVLAMSGLTVTGSLTLVGTRPVILAVWGDATVSGTISARSATGQDAGAGAYPANQCEIINGLVASTSVGAGGGGAGGNTPGGTGGDLTGTGGAPGGGPAVLRGTVTLSPLQGGCNGGAGGRPNDDAGTGGAGGKGGGAVQLSAAGTLQVSGTITASGAGGQGGLQDQTGLAPEGGNGGGGGGAGGAVLLEGRDVYLAGPANLTANGGGGGEGGDGIGSSGSRGNPGADGPATAPAGGAGGSGAVACAGDGAAGGSTAGPPGNAANVAYVGGGCAAGGGGGAAGRIRVNASQGCQIDAGVLSPSPTFGGTCP